MTKRGAANGVKKGWTQEALFNVGAPVPKPATPVAKGERITKAERVKRIERLKALGFKPLGDGSEVEVLVRCYECAPPFQWTSRLTDAAMEWFADHAEKHK